MNADVEGRNVEGRNVEEQDVGAAPEASSAGSAVEATAESRRPKTIIGSVHSDKMKKTRTVRVQRLVRHAKYGKYIRRRSTFYVHDENEISHEGDTVLIAETRPVSKLKRWRLVKVLSKGSGVRVVAGVDEGKEPISSP